MLESDRWANYVCLNLAVEELAKLHQGGYSGAFTHLLYTIWHRSVKCIQ